MPSLLTSSVVVDPKVLRIVCLLALHHWVSSAAVLYDRREMYESHLQSLRSRNINRLVPPFPKSGPILLEVFFQLHRIISLKSDSATLSVSGVIQLAWYDNRYRWNASTGAPSYLLYPAKEMWVPELSLSSSTDFDIRFGRTNDVDLVLLTRDGRAVLEKAMEVNVACDVDVHYFPRDVQHCTLVFLPPITHQELMSLRNYSVMRSTQPPTMGEEWSLLGSLHTFENTTAVNATGDTVQVRAYKVGVLLHRNYAFYFLTIIIPTIMLSLVTLVPYLLPPSQSAPKIIIPITTFLSFNIYMLLLEKILPRASSVPVLGQSYAILLAVCLITDVFQAMSVKFYSCRIKDIPRALGFLYLRIFACICCFHLCHGAEHMTETKPEVEIGNVEVNKEQLVRKKWLSMGRINDRVGLILSSGLVAAAFVYLFATCFVDPDIPQAFRR